MTVASTPGSNGKYIIKVPVELLGNPNDFGFTVVTAKPGAEGKVRVCDLSPAVAGSLEGGLAFFVEICHNKPMEIVYDKIELARLREMAKSGFGDMVKAVVDVERGVMAVDAELHSDQERLLLENGSKQEDLWGINLYPDIEGPGWIEFDSMINLRPWQGNPGRGVEDPEIRKRILGIVERLVAR